MSPPLWMQHIIECSSHYTPYLTTLVFKIGISILATTLLLYLYESVCYKYFHSQAESHQHGNKSLVETINCNKLSEKDQNVVQTHAANYVIAITILQDIPAFMMSLWCGGWMDRVGRRIPMILSCFVGSSIAAALALVQAFHGDGIVCILIAGTILAAFGPGSIVPAAVESFIMSRSTAADRTGQLAFNMAIVYLGLFSGSLLIAVMVDDLSFWLMFLLVALILLITAGLVAFVLPEVANSGPLAEDETAYELALLKQPGELNSEKTDDKMSPSSTAMKKVSTFYQIRNFTDALSTLTKHRPNNMRKLLLILLVATFIKTACKAGEVGLIFLFVRHYPLNWTKSDYSYLLAYQYAVVGLTLVLILPLLLKKANWTDADGAIATNLAKVFGLCILGISDRSWMVYIAIALVSLFGVSASCMRSMLSKMVDKDESGRCFNIIAAVETASDLVGAIVFTQLYSYGLTLNTFFGRSMTFYIMAVFHIIVTGMLMFVDRGLKLAAINSLEGHSTYEPQKADYEPIGKNTVNDSNQENNPENETKPADVAESTGESHE